MALAKTPEQFPQRPSLKPSSFSIKAHGLLLLHVKMAVARYSTPQLLHLRKSPLVCRPEGLPAIEQWME